MTWFLMCALFASAAVFRSDHGVARGTEKAAAGLLEQASAVQTEARKIGLLQEKLQRYASEPVGAEEPGDAAEKLAALLRRWPAVDPFGTFDDVKYLAGGVRDVFLAKPAGPLRFAEVGPQPANPTRPVVLKFVHQRMVDLEKLKRMCHAVNLAPDKVASAWPEGVGNPGTVPAGHFSRCYGYRYHEQGPPHVLILEPVPGRDVITLLRQQKITREVWREMTLQFLDIVVALYDANIFFSGDDLHPMQFVLDPQEKVMRLIDTDGCILAEPDMIDPDTWSQNFRDQLYQWMFYVVGTACCRADMGACLDVQALLQRKLFAPDTEQLTAEDIDSALADSTCDASILAKKPVTPTGKDGPSVLATLIHEVAPGSSPSRANLAAFRRTAAELFA